MAWITLNEVKAVMETQSTEHDNLINILIPAVKNLFITKSGYDPQQATVTEKFESNNNDRIVLSRSPLTAITHIKIHYGSSTITLTEDEYIAYKKGIIVFDSRITGVVEIQYTAGYIDTEIPEDITNVIILQVIDFVEKGGRLGVQSTGKMGESITYKDIPLLPEFELVCNLYNNPIPNRETL